MSVRILNRTGAISFSSSSLKSPYTSINEIVRNFKNPGKSNSSLSESFSLLFSNSGNSITDEKIPGYNVGVGLVNRDSTFSEIKMSELLGTNYISASFNIDPDTPSSGICKIDIDSTTLVANANYFTNQSQSRVYRYTQYSKPTADSSNPFQRSFSYVRSEDSLEYFTNLTTDKIYKVVAKDLVSSAFTSSIFTGSCTNTTVTSDSVQFSSNNTSNFPNAINSIQSSINAATVANTITQTQQNDLTNILNRLSTIINSPSEFPLSGFSRSFTVNWYLGGTRTYVVEGFTSNLTFGGRTYSGLVTCTGGTAGNTAHSYAIDQALTQPGLASIIIYALANNTLSTSCASAPTNQLSNFSVAQTCLYPAQSSNSITNVQNVRFTGSLLVTNLNSNNITNFSIDETSFINLNDNTNIYGTNLNPSFSPNNFPLSSNESKTVSVKFGESYWGNPVQPITLNVRGTATATFDAGSPSPIFVNINAVMDKNSCVVPEIPAEDTGGGCPAVWQLMETLEHGFIPAREIKVGMHLRDTDFDKWNKVTKAFISRAPIYRTIIENTEFDVDDSHQWYIGNNEWKRVTEIKDGDYIEGLFGKKLLVNKNYLLYEEEEFMHLNCENKRFVMGFGAIGHNFPGVKTGDTWTPLKKW